MKVLHMLQSSRFSGAENVVCQIIGFLREKYEFVYCSQDGQIRNALEERDIVFNPVNSMSLKEFKRVIHENEPDLIHAHDISASVLAGLASGKTPVISHVHVNNSDMAKINKKTILYLISSLKYKHIFWVSKSCYESFVFKKFVQKKSSVLFNVMDFDNILRKANQDRNSYPYDLVYVGRLSYQKNPQRMMRLFEEIIKEKPDVKIAVVGTGEFEQECKDFSQTNSLNQNIEFLGFQENPLKILKDSKAMVMTSRFEGTPMTALEAMALGVPIVSTPTDGMNDLITNGVNGYLSDDDFALKRELLKIIQDENCRSQLSMNTVKRFKSLMDCEKYKHEMIQAYKEAQI